MADDARPAWMKDAQPVQSAPADGRPAWMADAQPAEEAAPRKVGFFEAAQRSVQAASKRAASVGVADRDPEMAAKLRAEGARIAPGQPGEDLTIPGYAGEMAAGLLTGNIDMATSPVIAGQEARYRGESPLGVAGAQAASGAGTAAQLAATEFGGAVAGKFIAKTVLPTATSAVLAGVANVTGRSFGRGAGAAVGGPAARAIENLAAPDDQQQPVFSKKGLISDVSQGVAQGLLSLPSEAVAGAHPVRVREAGAEITGAGAVSPQLGTALGKKVQAQAVAAPEAPVRVHLEKAVDSLTADELRKASPRAAKMFDMGFSEAEVKGALKNHLTLAAEQVEASRAAPEPAPKSAAESIVSAFNLKPEAASGEAPAGDKLPAWDWKPEKPGAKPAAQVDPRVAALDEQILNEPNPHVQKVLKKQRDQIQDQLDKQAAAARLRQMAADALKQKDQAAHDLYTAEAEKLSPTPAPEPAPAAPAPSEGGPLVERRAMAEVPQPETVQGEIVPDEFAPPAPEQAALPAPPTPSLPAPGARVVTPGGRVMTAVEADAARRGRIDEEAPAAAEQHPGFTQNKDGLPVETGADVGLVAGMSPDGVTTVHDASQPRHIYVRHSSGEVRPFDVTESRDYHERVEKAELDAGKHYFEAHRAATEAEHARMRQLGYDPNEIEDRLQPYVDRAAHRARAEGSTRNVTAEPYIDSGETGMMAEGAAEPRRVYDATGKQHTDPEHGKLSTGNEIVMAKGEDGVWRAIDPHSGQVFAEGKKSAKSAQQAANARVAKLGKKKAEAWFEKQPPKSQQQLRHKYEGHINADVNAPERPAGSSREGLGAVQRPEEKAGPEAGDHADEARNAGQDVGGSDAGQVRGDQGQADQGREAGGAGEVQRGGDLQRPAEAGPEASDRPGEAAQAGDRGTQEVARKVQPTSSLSRTASWVVKNKTTGEIVMETFDPKVVEKLNTEKYEAVPIQEHLAGLNREIREKEAESANQNPSERGGAEPAPAAGAEAGEPAAPREAEVQRGAGAGTGEGEPAAGGVEGTKFQRGTAARRGMRRDAVQKVVDDIRAGWKNAPEVVLHDSLEADTVSAETRAEAARQRKGGAKGDELAWTEDGKIHINLSAVHGKRQIAMAMAHEAIGHLGVERVFGDALHDVLDSLIKQNRGDIEERARAYGLDSKKVEDLRLAASERLAKLAQTNPEMGVVRRAIAAIASWLRKNIPALRGMKFTDSEIIRDFIKPAQDYVMRGVGRDGIVPDTGGVPREAFDPLNGKPKFARGPLVEPPPEEARTIGWNEFRERLSVAARFLERADAMLGPARKLFDQWIGKDYQGLRDQYRAYEEHGVAATDPELQKSFEAIKQLTDELYNGITATGRPLGYVTNYLAHLYKDPNRAEKWFTKYVQDQLGGASAAPAAFTKERFYKTLRDAEDAGLEPLHKNIVDMQMMRFGQMRRYQAMHEFRNMLESRGWLLPEVEGAISPPPGWGKVQDPIFQRHWIPESLARDLSNFLDPGVSQYAWWKSMRALQGAMTSMNLGFSAFHPLATTFDVVSNRLQSVVERAFRGQGGLALKELSSLPSDLVSAFTAAVGAGKGHEMQRAWAGTVQGDPVTQLIMRATEMGGGRGQMSLTTDIGAAQLMRAFRQRDIKGGLVAAVKALIENTAPIVHHMIVPAQKWLAKDISVRLELDKRAKALGVQPGDYQAIMDAMHPDTLQQIMASVMDQVDDRLGQYTYVNRRIKRSVLQAMQIGLRSPGWFLGGANTMLRPIADLGRIVKPEKLVAPLDVAGTMTDEHMGRITPRLAYFTTMMTAYAMVNAGLNSYIHDGYDEGVKDWRDFFSVRLPDGNRFIPASYAKEAFEWLRAPIHRVESAASPLVSTVHEGWGVLEALMGGDSKANRDYFGNMIVNPDAPAEQQMGEIVHWAGTKFMPFALGGKEQMPGAPDWEKNLPYAGVNLAPAALSDTRTEEAIKNRYYAQREAKNLPPETAEAGQAVFTAAKGLRRDPNYDVSNLSAKEQQAARKMAASDPTGYKFSVLPLEQQVSIYEKAPADERESLKMRQSIMRMFVSKKGRSQLDALPPEEAARVREKIQAMRN